MADDPELIDSLRANGVSATAMRPVSGGDIAASWRIETSGVPVFVKTLPAAEAGALTAERDGLTALAATGTLRIPELVAGGTTSTTAWLALEWLELSRLDDDSEAALGRGLAALHRCGNDRFGWATDNFIGRTPQPNAWQAGWSTFFTRFRLGFQFALARDNGAGHRFAERADTLLERLPDVFAGHRPKPSLVHGDLWSGNAAASDRVPVVFDPAVHYGDRETDLAMTRLFGGFGPRFYAAYESEYPLDAGYPDREAVYQLYHVVNHYNLFGAGYLGQAEALIDRTLRRFS